MSQAAISRGKEIIKQQIRLALRGEVVRISVEDEANLAVFEQALRSFDIQRMLVQKNVIDATLILMQREECAMPDLDINFKKILDPASRKLIEIIDLLPDHE